MSGDGWPAFPAWQPIETAPKDGVSVLVWVPKEPLGEGSMRVARYVPFADQPGWYSHISAFHKPTHWMPLPTPPDATLAARERDDG